MHSTLLVAREVSKQYGAFYALQKVSVELKSGELVAVMGENGAGKSTLMKILAGIEAPSAGHVEVAVDGTLREVSPRDLENYISIVPQEIDLADDRSVAENIFMGIEPGNRWFPSRSRILKESQKLLTRISSGISPSFRAGDLDSASKQMVLIARALARKAQVVIFDEPTANLSPRESRALFNVIRGLKSDGVGVLYVSHRIPEVMMLSDRIEVLRDGLHSGSWITAETTDRQVVNSMVGRELDFSTRLEEKSWPQEVSLKVSELSGSSFSAINFSVHPGQVLGIAGLPDSGREELLRTIYGDARMAGGSISVHGKEIGDANVSDSVKAGVAYLPGERRAAGIFPTMSVKDNISSLVAKRYTKFGFIQNKKLAEVSSRFARAVNVRAASLDLPITSLSGGNQQKALIARLLATEPKVLLLDEPTRGVDVGAKSEVYSVVNGLTEKGMAVLLSSSDLPELLSQCHQIAVMFRGRIVTILDASTTSEEEIMAYATLGRSMEESK